jgi:hypothetical protein
VPRRVAVESTLFLRPSEAVLGTSSTEWYLINDMRSPLTFVIAFLLGVPAMSQVSLPAPGGSFPVGRTSVLWTDPSRLEDVGPTTGKPREVLAYVYYPAAARGSKVEYFPGLGSIEGANDARFLRQQFGALWNSVVSGAIRTNAYDAPPLASGKKKFPVLIFSPGLLAPVLAYQLQLEELASRGYVIFGLEHGTDSALLVRPDRTLLPYVSRRAPDPGPPTIGGLEASRDQVVRWTADISFALNRIESLAREPNATFRNRLDLSRIGAFGHSEGGKAAVRSCQTDRRVHACLNQDGEMFGIPFNSTNPIPSLLPERSIAPPLAVIYVAEPGIPDSQLAAARVSRAQYEEWRAAKNRALRNFLKERTRDSYLITIDGPGFVHGSFMDIRLLGSNPSPQDVANHQTGIDITRRWFDAELQGGDPKAWNTFTATANAGITIEHLSRPGSR